MPNEPNDILALLSPETLRQLCTQSVLQQALLVEISADGLVLRANASAQNVLHLRPMAPPDEVLSASALAALRDCLHTGTAHQLSEELDDQYYDLQILPQNGGAVLAWLRNDSAAFDGSLRILHRDAVRLLSSLLLCSDQAQDATLADRLRRTALRLQRTLRHSDLLHDLPSPDFVRMEAGDLAALCRRAVAAAQEKSGRTITLHAPEALPLVMNEPLVRAAVLNLLVNALQASPPDTAVEVFVQGGDLPTVSVADRGSGLSAAALQQALTAWQRPMSEQEYLEAMAIGPQPGFGLPFVRCVATLHGGKLFCAPRDGGGTVLYLSLARLSNHLTDPTLLSPFDELDATCEELELSVL